MKLTGHLKNLRKPAIMRRQKYFCLLDHITTQASTAAEGCITLFSPRGKNNPRSAITAMSERARIVGCLVWQKNSGSEVNLLSFLKLFLQKLLFPTARYKVRPVCDGILKLALGLLTTTATRMRLCQVCRAHFNQSSLSSFFDFLVLVQRAEK